MKYKIHLFVIIIFLISCTGTVEDLDLNDGFVAEGEYKFYVESSLFGSDSLVGSTTKLNPAIGHASIGPEDYFCSSPEDNAPLLGALWMTFDSLGIVFDPETPNSVPATELNYSIYLIRYWCKDVGEQEANWYEIVNVEPNSSVRFGIDERGIEYLKGVVHLEGKRTLVNQADVPEDITISGDFTAVER